MTELYKIHFGFSRSKKYHQAIEIAKLAHQYKIKGEGEDIWHIATFTERQYDLMASLYKIAKNLPRPKMYGVDVISIIIYLKNGYYNYAYASNSYKERVLIAGEKLKKDTGKNAHKLVHFLEKNYWKLVSNNMEKVRKKLTQEGYIDYQESITGNLIRAKKRPKEPIPEYREIRKLISRGRYRVAVKKYYDVLGNRFYSELHNELIYLKRLANIELEGRDLLYFRNESSRSEFITSNLSEYCSCIDKVIEQYRRTGLKLPLNIICDNAPTMEELIEKRKKDWHLGVYLCDGDFKRDNTKVTLDNFSAQYDKCPEGRLFDRYPDPVQHCRIIEIPKSNQYDGSWTTISPSYYQKEILDKGFHINRIEVYRHKLWKRGQREPDFTAITSPSEIDKSGYGTDGIRYTGRNFNKFGKEFYEIDLIRYNQNLSKDLGNPFIELVEEILREAENLLRENHGLPRIGEGWIAEMHLYDLVKNTYPDAQHQASPDWLKPQHLDVFVPSENLAFEYQGEQHFEPVDFFGGEESFINLRKLDRRKMKKCKMNGISLIYWRYDEPINYNNLIKKSGLY